jgi:hypothetical protein
MRSNINGATISSRRPKKTGMQKKWCTGKTVHWKNLVRIRARASAVPKAKIKIRL